MTHYGLLMMWSSLTTLSVFGVFVAGHFCPQGWESLQDRCYLYVNRLLTWSAAKEICNGSSSSLVETESEEENSFVHNMMRAHGAQVGVWLNIDDRTQEGHWVSSTTHQPLTYSKWNDGEPNNMDDEDCGMMRLPGNWNDLNCQKGDVNNAVCEKVCSEAFECSSWTKN
ncbi:C-type lectin domain family 17, member A-like isoform X1 [Pomacea canaliculata]|uniref:C-type lectin domain family 17, member A-like isoform X1 n=1 Tax=Pomacea canaliculata TaxID=400727 RepID=UPI000D73CA14|nr:C-type lectin domain family 17, member A-like isoform X1 [Pomacea canaliculata]